jgi:hypothetical protein
MPAHYEFDVEAGLLLSTFAGSVTEQEARDYDRDLHEDAQFREGMPHLVDALQVETAGLSANTIKTLTRKRPGYRPGRLAIVLNRGNSVAYGLAKLAAAMRRILGDDVKIFDCPVAAREWLTTAAH